MDEIIVNRFKTYRKLRWIRSNYLWKPEVNKYLKKFNITVNNESNLSCDVLAIPLPHLPGKENFAHKDTWLFIQKGYVESLITKTFLFFATALLIMPIWAQWLGSYLSFHKFA